MYSNTSVRFHLLFDSITVYAKQTQIDVKLPVTQKFTITNNHQDSINQSGFYELIAMDSTTPIPEEGSHGKYNFTLDGNEQKQISMTYVHGGIYQYRLYQTTENKDRYGFDRHIYTISVYVRNDDNGELKAQVIVENEKNEKCEDITFENTYTGIKKPTTQRPSNSIGTSDDTQIHVWITMIIVASLGMIMTFILRQKSLKNK